MAAYDDQIDGLRNLAGEAADSVGNVPDAIRAEHREAFDRMASVLPYTQIVIGATDGALVSQQAASGVESALLTIRDNIVAQPQSADGWAMQLLDALAAFPVARGQDLAIEAKDAAAKFQQSAAQRLTRLQMQAQTLDSKLDGLQSSMTSQAEDVGQALDARKAEADQLVADVKSAVEEERGRIQTAATDQAEAFRAAQEGRASDFGARLDEFSQELEKHSSTAIQEADKALGQIKKVHEDVVGMSGAIGLQGTAKKYEDEFNEQKSTANLWRLVTVGTVILAVLAALLAASADDTSDPAFVSRFLISIALGALATYTARQSSRHRRREERSRDLQLELSAFSPFIEPLPNDEKIEERVQMTRKTFGVAARSLDEDEDDGGPTFMSQVMRRRTREQSQE